MELLETVRRLFHGKRYNELDQQETEALVDALCYAIAADGEVQTVEREQLAEHLEDVAWNSDQPISAYIAESLDRASERVERDEDPVLYARSIRDRIDDQSLQEDIYLFCAKIATADEHLDPREQELLAELVNEFDIPQETVEDVTGWIIYESDLQKGGTIPAESDPNGERLREPEAKDKTPTNADSATDTDWE